MNEEQIIEKKDEEMKEEKNEKEKSQKERFNEMFSNKKLGFTLENGKSIFRLFVPRGVRVNLIIFEKYDDENGTVYEMINDENQVFECVIDEELWGKYYGYQIVERSYKPSEMFPKIPQDTIIADPYSNVVATNNVFPQKGRTLIYDISQFDWEDDKPLELDIKDTIILEAHIRDLTAHHTAKSDKPGTYLGLSSAKQGGLEYIKKLGINAIEFLPIQKFGNIEPPYKKESHGYFNDWNTYSQNYWGYMPSNYFAPETYYASDGTLDKDKWNGTDGRVVNEVREMVKELHRNGIAVIIDVVYNHVSQYDENPLRIIDHDFYFKEHDFTGCGNELESRRKMTRRLIIDSLIHWMKEYHVDGFRFDLATSFDRETIDTIYEECRKVNPKVFLIAEPWGGETAISKQDFVSAGWSQWNDSARTVFRGWQNRPTKKGQAFVLGNAGNSDHLIPYWKGNSLGESYQSVAYLESHDDMTFSEIIKILSGEYQFKDERGKVNRLDNIWSYIKLTPHLLGASKIGAVALFLCQGPIMIHLGQEWGRSKIVPHLSGRIEEITDKGEIGESSDNVMSLVPTPNSYNADNETNWINYDFISANQSLYEFYRGLIGIRRSYPLLGSANPEQIEILKNENRNGSAIGVNIAGTIFGFVNADLSTPAFFEIPAGIYKIVVNKEKADKNGLGRKKGGEIVLKEASQLILIKED